MTADSLSAVERCVLLCNEARCGVSWASFRVRQFPRKPSISPLVYVLAHGVLSASSVRTSMPRKRRRRHMFYFILISCCHIGQFSPLPVCASVHVQEVLLSLSYLTTLTSSLIIWWWWWWWCHKHEPGKRHPPTTHTDSPPPPPPP